MSNYSNTLVERSGNAWTRFWFTPGDPIVLSLIRVLTGLLAIWWYLGFYADLQAWFGPQGLFTLEATLRTRTDELGTTHFAFSVLDYVETASQLWLVYGLGMGALVLMTLGVFSRVTTIASLLIVVSFIHRAPILARPVDDLLAILTFYLCIGPSGAYYSIDAGLRKRRERVSQNTSMPIRPTSRLSSAATVAIRLMQVHLALIYVSMAIAQLQGEAWWQGTAIWWLMARPESRLIDLTGMHSLGLAFEYLVNFLTHAILIYEISFALLIWNDLARPILLVLGLLFWTGIAIIGGAITFSVAMLIASLAFLRPETLHSWCGCLPKSDEAVNYV